MVRLLIYPQMTQIFADYLLTVKGTANAILLQLTLILLKIKYFTTPRRMAPMQKLMVAILFLLTYVTDRSARDIAADNQHRYCIIKL